MPELPEMEHYRTLLNSLTAGRSIVRVSVNRPRSLNKKPELFAANVEGASIAEVQRRGKHLLFQLDAGPVLLLHLMLGGWMFYGDESDKPDRTTQVELDIDGGRTLYFIGLRLGFLHLLHPEEVRERLSRLGPDALSPALDARLLQERFKGSRRGIKHLLTDQSRIAGIGNCYADEICFAAGLRPTSALNGSAGAAERLAAAIGSVLREATAAGGYMEHPLFTGDSRTGAYNERCAVYDREGEACIRCGHLVKLEMNGGRKCYYCPGCQE